MIDLIRKALERGARLSYGSKWLVIDVSTNTYEVYESGRIYHQRGSRKLIDTENLELALNILMEIE